MRDKAHQARIAAMSIAQCRAVVDLLRAHELQRHAADVESALEAVVLILSREIGPAQLAQAMDWISEETGAPGETPAPSMRIH